MFVLSSVTKVVQKNIISLIFAVGVCVFVFGSFVVKANHSNYNLYDSNRCSSQYNSQYNSNYSTNYRQSIGVSSNAPIIQQNGSYITTINISNYNPSNVDKSNNGIALDNLLGMNAVIVGYDGINIASNNDKGYFQKTLTKSSSGNCINSHSLQIKNTDFPFVGDYKITLYSDKQMTHSLGSINMKAYKSNYQNPQNQVIANPKLNYQNSYYSITDKYLRDFQKSYPNGLALDYKCDTNSLSFTSTKGGIDVCGDKHTNPKLTYLLSRYANYIDLEFGSSEYVETLKQKRIITSHINSYTNYKWDFAQLDRELKYAPRN